MKFAPMKEILKLAEEQKIAYGAYVTVSYETARAAIEAGSELNIPVIFITGTEGETLQPRRAFLSPEFPLCFHFPQHWGSSISAW